MIPVIPAGVPAGFARKVVTPAKKWVAKKPGWSWTSPPPPKCSGDLPDYWTECLDDLHTAYGGVCAYLSVYTHRALQSTSVDHFQPKSKAPVSEAYNWANYRLASRSMNTNKREFQDVLDPFAIPAGLFQLNLLNGRMSVNSSVAPRGSSLNQQARATLKRLKLNTAVFCELRLEHIHRYLAHHQATATNAQQHAQTELLLAAPFIGQEVIRQGW